MNPHGVYLGEDYDPLPPHTHDPSCSHNAPELYCNHDAAAVHEGTCECGVVVDHATAKLARMLSRDDMTTAEIAAEIAADVLGRLYDAAGAYEVETLDGLVKSAGLRWDCQACPWTNREHDTTCEQCHRERATVEG